MRPRPGIRFRWWIGDPHKPPPEGGLQDPAVHIPQGEPGVPRCRAKISRPNHPERLLPYTLLDAELQ
jgi:hypothetical protein